MRSGSRSIGVPLLALLAAAGSAEAGKVEGRFLYVDRAFSFDHGFTGAEPNRPIRRALVEVIDDATGLLIASGATDEDGDVVISVAGGGSYDVIVRCYSRSEVFQKSLRVSSTSNLEYSASSALYPSWSSSSNLDFGTVVAQKVTASQGNVGSPFNMLDMMVGSVQYLKSVGAPDPPFDLQMAWPSGSSSASGVNANIAGDDGFDDLVQLHEFAHVIHNVYSDSDSPGGSHMFGQSDQDPRLSFSEGWASWFAGAVRRFMGEPDPGFYIDCLGQGQVGSASIQVRARFEDAFPYDDAVGGEADELAVASVLWDVIDDVATDDGDLIDDDPLDGAVSFPTGISPDEALWASFVGLAAQTADVTVASLWDGLFAPVVLVPHDEVCEVFADWKLRFERDAAEPDSATAPSLLFANAQWSATRTLYDASPGAYGPGLSDVDHFLIPITTGTTFEVETRYPSAVPDAETFADPYLRILRPDGSEAATDDDSGVGRNARVTVVADQSGSWLAEVSSVHPYRRSGSYEIRARVTGSPSGGCLNVATATAYGVGKAGIGGTPALDALTLPIVPGVFSLGISNGPPNVTGWVLFSDKPIEVPFDLGTVYVAPDHVYPIQTDANGNAQLDHPSLSKLLCGLTAHAQVFFLGDPGAAGLWGSSHSARLTFTYGS